MENCLCSNASGAPGPAEEAPAPDGAEEFVSVHFSGLSGDEVERLIALCEAPSLLWGTEPAPPRPAEPFGMIA